MQRSETHDQRDGCSACSAGVLESGQSLWKQKGVLTAAAGGIVFCIGLYLEFVARAYLIAQISFLAVVLIAGQNIIKRGILSAWRRRPDMNFLMSVAAAGAFSIGHGEEGAAVILLFYIAEFLEDYAAERARKSVASLLKLAPERARVKRGGEEIEVHVHEVKAGDVVIVRPGDRIPLDGVVVRGQSSVNQAPITGESMPVSKEEGESVFAGTINEEGYLEIRVTKTSEETALSKIIKIVEQAQKQKSRTEAFIDRFARYYTPLVVTLSFLVMTVPTLVFGLEFSEWFYRALVLLVVSCPCALAISTPVSMVSGLTSAARNGVLIKGGSYLEEIRNARVVVFDKTGTLTEGKPEVTDVIALGRYSRKKVLQIAASLEAKSKHPLAEAVVAKAREEGIGLLEVRDFRSLAGKGLKGRVGGRLFYTGNRNFFAKAAELPEKHLKALESRGKTAVLIGNGRHVIGIIALMDRIRESSYGVIKELKDRGVRTVMLTGDNRRVAEAIAESLGIDEHYAELLPEDKVNAIDRLLKMHEHVVMVGDGVNDAPALAKAHVGIAMGAIGSDVAIETSDIALMHDDLTRIGYLMDLSRRTIAVVKQNISAAILIKGSFAILAFPGLVSLWLAVAIGDMGLSLAVIANALRIGKKKVSVT